MNKIILDWGAKCLLISKVLPQMKKKYFDTSDETIMRHSERFSSLTYSYQDGFFDDDDRPFLD